MTASLAAVPAWSLTDDAPVLATPFPAPVTRDWAWGGSTGAGARVCILDSGVEATHPALGKLASSVAVDDDLAVVEANGEDLAGHGTACAGIVRSLAPECEITSVRILGSGARGTGPALLAGLRWAVDQCFDVINLSLSTTKAEFVAALHELADGACFGRCVLVASAHNLPVKSYPWQFSSVLSVGSHKLPEPFTFFVNPAPPVEFFARGVGVPVAQRGGGTMRATGNSFAAPHMAGICALILAKHPELTVFQLKTVLSLTSSNQEVNR